MRQSAEFLKPIDGTPSLEATARGTRGQHPPPNNAPDWVLRFDLPETTRFPASVIYHQHSELSPEWECPLTEDEIRTLTLDANDQRYPNAPRLALPVTPPLHVSLESAIRTRRTASRFIDTPMGLLELAKLLQFACGVTREGRLPLRAAPSAGGLYAIDTYAAVFNVDGLNAGVHHYTPSDHSLHHTKPLAGVEELWQALPPGWWGEMPAVAIVLIARLARVQAKYGERGYRFVLLESGHIAQNLLLCSSAMQLRAAGVGGFFDDEMNSLIGVDGEEHVALYAVLIGRSECKQP